MIEAQSLTKSFGPIRAVDGISFVVKKGEVLGFLGPNGAGKSTTMKMLTGFLTPTSGDAKVCGHDVSREPILAKRRLGYLPEGAPLYADMTPAGFLGFVAAVRGLKGAARQERLKRAIAMAQIGSVYNQPIETLSKGFKRRVGLAQALLHDPDVLVLDEPTDGLDPNQKHDVRKIIKDMAPEKAIIISTHILEEVEAICTRAVVIAQGRIVADGTPGELSARSQRHNAILLRLRGAMPGAGDALQTLPGVAGVDVEDEGRSLTVLAKPGETILETVNGFVRDKGWPVAQLSVERGQLDEVFRTITRGGAAGGRA